MKPVKSAYLRSIGAQILCLILFGLVGVASAGNIDEVRSSVYAWCKSWQNRDIDTYMSFYSQNFRSKELDYRGWMQKKKRRFHMVGSLRVDISDLGVFVEGETAVARFIQRYQDSKISDVGEKTLSMIYTGGKWKIVAEAWKPLTAPTRISGEWETASEPKKRTPVPSPVDKAKQVQTANALSKPAIVVKSIKFESQKKLEKLFIASNKYFVPKVLTLEGDHPKVVIDIKPVSSWSGPYITPTNGNLIRQIRTYLHPGSDTLRIILDLNPSENYHINQICYEKKNICCIEIR
jgi:ketosteroid isomerase-like protein